MLGEDFIAPRSPAVLGLGSWLFDADSSCGALGVANSSLDPGSPALLESTRDQVPYIMLLGDSLCVSSRSGKRIVEVSLVDVLVPAKEVYTVSLFTQAVEVAPPV